MVVFPMESFSVKVKPTPEKWGDSFKLVMNWVMSSSSGAPPAIRGAVPAGVGWDHVRTTIMDTDQRKPAGPSDRFVIEDAFLEDARSTLGELVDHARGGRWTLRPRADTCPATSSWSHDHCPFVGACRLRALPPRDVVQPP